MAELALAHHSYLILKAYDLPPDTRQWLIIPDTSKVLVMALRRGEDDQPTSIVVVADHEDAHWSELSLNAVITLVYQLAWWEGQQQIIQNLESNTEKL
ncbi:MAG: ATP-binding protein, partial [Sphaerospermopsis kisseleviana]